MKSSVGRPIIGQLAFVVDAAQVAHHLINLRLDGVRGGVTNHFGQGRLRIDSSSKPNIAA